MYSIHNTKDWPFERLAPYGSDLLEALDKIVQKYPDDLSLELLVADIFSGKRDLWLILQGQNFVAFVTSYFEISANGKKQLVLLELAGKGGVNLAYCIKALEDYAKSSGAQQLCAIGRLGWTKIMRSLGYQAEIVKFKKEIADGTSSKRNHQ